MLINKKKKGKNTPDLITCGVASHQRWVLRAEFALQYVIIYGKVHTFYFWLNKGSMFDGPFPFFNKDLTWSQRSQEGSSECPKKECFKINHLRPSCPVSSQKGSRRAMPKTLMQDRIVSLPVGRRSPDFQVK
jgi:hypothetical protein